MKNWFPTIFFLVGLSWVGNSFSQVAAIGSDQFYQFSKAFCPFQQKIENQFTGVLFKANLNSFVGEIFVELKPEKVNLDRLVRFLSSLHEAETHFDSLGFSLQAKRLLVSPVKVLFSEPPIRKLKSGVFLYSGSLDRPISSDEMSRVMVLNVYLRAIARGKTSFHKFLTQKNFLLSPSQNQNLQAYLNSLLIIRDMLSELTRDRKDFLLAKRNLMEQNLNSGQKNILKQLENSLVLKDENLIQMNFWLWNFIHEYLQRLPEEERKIMKTKFFNADEFPTQPNQKEMTRLMYNFFAFPEEDCSKFLISSLGKEEFPNWELKNLAKSYFLIGMDEDFDLFLEYHELWIKRFECIQKAAVKKKKINRIDTDY